MITLKVSKPKFTDALKFAASSADVTTTQMAFNEGIAVSKKLTQYNKPASAGNIRAGVNYRALRDNQQGYYGKMTINTGRRGGEKSRAWYKINANNGHTGNVLFAGMMSGEVLSKKQIVVGYSKIHLNLSDLMVNRSYPDVRNIIERSKSIASQNMAPALNSRGLTAKTWWDAGIMISSKSGINIKEVLPSITFRFSNASTIEGTYLHVTNVDVKNKSSGITLIIRNDSVLADQKGRGQSQANRAIRERLSLLTRALRKRWFNDSKYLEKNFPGLKVKE